MPRERSRPDGARWISCRPGFFLPVRVLSRLFRRLFLEGLAALNASGRLAFHGDLAHLAEAEAFATVLAPLRRADWVVYAKRPFGGPEAVLAYLARYTHRVAIANSRIIAMDRHGVTFRWKDYRARSAGETWRKTMTLTAPEFIRRFLLHVLPDGFHRIRHCGLLTSSRRAETIARIRQIIAAATPATTTADREPAISAERSDPVDERRPPCPCCGGRMILVERFAPGTAPRTRMRLESARMRTTRRFFTFTRSPPVRPAMRVPLNTRPGVAQPPIEPGLRWLRCAPCEAETPAKP